MKSFLAALPILLALAGCAGHPKPVHVSTTEGPETAIAEQQEMIQTSAKGHADVLAPREKDSTVPPWWPLAWPPTAPWPLLRPLSRLRE